MRREAASRFRTAEAIVWLLLARLLIAIVPFRWWRHTLGAAAAPTPMAPRVRAPQPLAASVLRAAARMPFPVKCLPQAMALGWMLRRRHQRYVLKIAARAARARDGDDALHAWVELPDGTTLGYHEGPLTVIFALSGAPRR